MPTPPKKPDLSFEPLSPGLGFHPFSDGLPYAPVSKNPTSSKLSQGMGTGAVAAGLPGYMPPPPPNSSRVSIQQPRMPAPVAPRGPTRTQISARAPVRQSPATNAKVQAEALTAQLTSEMLQPTFGFGYLFKRMFAYLIDSLVNLGLCAGALSAALWKQDLNADLLLSPGILLVASLFLGFFNWAITTAEEVAFGTSIGKRLFGLAIQGSASAIFLRSFFFIPSVCFGGIGLLWSIFDRRRRCWHDLVVDLQPMEIASL